MAEAKEMVRRLLDEAGTTYAHEAGIRLDDKPMPLFELLVLCMLASKPIDATIAVQAARELFAEKLRTPDAVRAADRKTMIDAFGRASYARYDESSATRLTEMADAVHDEYGGDLRRLGESRDVDTVPQAPQGVQGHRRHRRRHLPSRSPGHLDVGATPVRRPGPRRAKELGLPDDPEALRKLAGERPAQLAAALVRVSLDDDLRERVKPRS